MKMAPNDLLAFIGSFIYVGGIIHISKVLRKRGYNIHTLRESTHMLMGVWPVFWFLFETKIAAVLVTVIITVFLVLAPKNIRRIYSDNNEKHHGLVIYSVMFTLITFFWWMTYIGAAAIFTLAFADGSAGFVGKKFGKHKFKSLGGRERSIEGSVAFFIASILSLLFACFLYSWVAPHIVLIVLYGVVTSMTEALSPPHFDNLFVPVVAILFISFVL